MSKVLAKVYEHEGKSVEILFSETIYFNATVAGKAFGRIPRDWLRLDETKNYIEGVSAKTKIDKELLVKRNNGGLNPSTWIHNELKEKYMDWLNRDRNKKYSLYIILLSTGIIKVGKSINGIRRIREHAYEASKYGVSILKYSIDDNQKLSENDLINYCSSVSTSHVGKEYFSGLDFDDVVSFVNKESRIECKSLRHLQRND